MRRLDGHTKWNTPQTSTLGSPRQPGNYSPQDPLRPGPIMARRVPLPCPLPWLKDSTAFSNLVILKKWRACIIESPRVVAPGYGLIQSRKKPDCGLAIVLVKESERSAGALPKS